MISEEQNRRFQDYCNNNPSICADRVVKDFFQSDDHVQLLLQVLDGSFESQQQLENAFRKHYFRVRFIKYLVSTIKFCAIDQMRTYQRNSLRNPLIFDHPALKEGSASTIGELLANTNNPEPSEANTSDPEEFQSSITNELLAEAFAQLTQKQKTIATLGYGMCYRDNEIATLLGVSPQAVCKMRNHALQKLRVAFPERRDYSG
ncbi:RNA polymerase sigma factor SigO [Paenibacillus plantiphilus]|uniref:RNA polymerase sigma factor SigO n=1 Tax=Paenibacillus plantiphilus TaxID=2905650 RepID=A0ABN8G5S2_9BACL|nr:sigma-70 family RNA polymerase sigma factor [Paenibacillus plantiphilus]CAH1200513.1 RNA polymerase sigma factor SigO [Paenibacillus plantiphilus]